MRLSAEEQRSLDRCNKAISKALGDDMVRKILAADRKPKTKSKPHKPTRTVGAPKRGNGKGTK